MNVLTKVFVVFHVIVSLLLAAGLIVFVNRTENFRQSLADMTVAKDSATSQLAAKVADAAAARDDANTYRKRFEDSQAALATAKSGPEATIAELRASLSAAQTDAKIRSASFDTLTAAFNNSEQQRAALSTNLASTRGENDTLNKKNSELNVALTDAVTKWEVAVRSGRDNMERLAEAQAEVDRLQKTIAQAGLDKGKLGNLPVPAPRINAVVQSIETTNGIRHATISVGSDQDVKPGMVFYVIDRARGQFLGMLTIDGVDSKAATGKLDGPKVSEINKGSEARTQL